MFEKIKERLSKLKTLDYILIIVIILLFIMFAVITLKNEKPYNNYVNGSDLSITNLSTYQDNDIVNLASPDLIGKEYLGNGWYFLNTSNGVDISYNVYSGNFKFNGIPTGNVVFTERIFDIKQSLISFTFIKENGSSNLDYIYYNYEDIKCELTRDIRTNDFKINENIFLRLDIIRFVFVDYTLTPYENYEFKLQLEQGLTTTTYQTPIGALKQHSQLEYDRGYDLGYDTGYIDGVGNVVKDFVEGNEWNFLQYEQSYATNVNVNMASNCLTTYIDIPINAPKEAGFNYLQMNLSFLKNLRIINKPIQEGAIQVGTHFSLRNENNQELTKVWNILDDDFQILYELPNVYKIRLNIMYFVDNPNMTEFQRMQQQSIISSLINQLTNEGKYFTFYIKEGIVFDTDVLGHFIDYQKNIIHLDYVTELVQEYEKGLNKGLNDGYDNGYKDGMTINPNDNFGSMIKAILLGVGTVLGIQLLPNITIGAIIAVPIVFGIIAFVLGRKKE